MTGKSELEEMVAFMRLHGIKHLKWGANEVVLLEGEDIPAPETDGDAAEKPNGEVSWASDDNKRKPTLKKYD